MVVRRNQAKPSSQVMPSFSEGRPAILLERRGGRSGGSVVGLLPRMS